MIRFVYTAMLTGKALAKVKNARADFKPSEFTSYFKLAEIE